MKGIRPVVAAIAASLLVACKLQVSVPSTGGAVFTESGNYSCAAGRSCTINISNTNFDESFVALPAAGYVFSGWKKQPAHLCGGSGAPCALTTAGFAGNSVLMSFLNGSNADTTLFLEPVFEPLNATGDILVSNSARYSYRPSAAALPDGGFVVTWLDYTGPDGVILARLYNAAGAPVSGITTISQGQGAYDCFPHVVSIGGDLIAFVYGLLDFNADADIVGQIYDADLNPNSGEFLVNTTTTGDQCSSDAAALRDGDFVVVWESINWSNRLDNRTNGLFSQRVSTQGRFPTEETRVEASNGDDTLAPSVAGLANGGFVVSWTQDLGDGRAWTALAQEYASRGYTIENPIPVDAATSGNHYYTNVLALPSGGFAVLWEQLEQEPTDGYFYSDIDGRIFDASRNPIGEKFSVNAVTQGNQSILGGTVLQDGTILPVWDSFGVDPENSFGRKFDSLGSPLGTDFQLNEQSGQTYYTGAETLQDGRVLITWERNANIYVRILSADGG